MSSDQELRVLRNIRYAGMTKREAARAEGLTSNERIDEILEDAMREAALERIEHGAHELARELLGLQRVQRTAHLILADRCPTCDGAVGNCPDCRGSGYRHSLAERLQAGDQLIAAATVKEKLVGPGLRAAAGDWPPLETRLQRFRNALGETTREDFEELLDAYIAKDNEFIARAIAGQTTRFPRFAEHVRTELRRLGLLSKKGDSAQETQKTPPQSAKTKSDKPRREPEPQAPPNAPEAEAKDPTRQDPRADGYHGQPYGAEPTDTDFLPPRPHKQ